MKRKYFILTFLMVTLLSFNIKDVEANEYRDVYITDSVNIRDANDYIILGILDRGDYINGKQIGDWIYFTYNDKQAKVFEKYTTTEKVYSKEAIATCNLNIRNLSGEIIGILEKGELVQGYVIDGYIYFSYNGISAKVYEPLTIDNEPETLYIKFKSNIRNNDNKVVDQKDIGNTIYGIKMGNKYRFYENGVKYIHQSLVTSEEIYFYSGVAKCNVNIRNSLNDDIVDVLYLGKYVNGYYLNGYIHFQYKGQEVKVYEPLIEKFNPSTLYIKHKANVRNSRLNIIGTINKGEKIEAIPVGNYVRYYDDGTKLVHSSLVSDKPVYKPKLGWPAATTKIIEYYRTASYRAKYGQEHWGIDIAGPRGTAIYAAEKGTVIETGWNSRGYGYTVLIDHGNGLRTRYAHMATNPPVRRGQKVDRGQYIGPIGNTGYSFGNHLHFEVIVNGYRVNPLPYIQ